MRRVLLSTLFLSAVLMLSAQTATLYYSSIPDFGTATENNLSTSISVDATGTDIEFSNDGLKMFVIGTTTDFIYEYTLTTAFDITTASYSGNSFSVATQETNPQGFVFNPDGTKLFVVGSTSDRVHEYNLSTAFSISTATSANSNISIASQETSPTGLEFNPQGSKMYVIGSTGRSIYQYDLSTNFSVSTATYSSTSFSVASQTTNPSDIELAPNGKSVFVMDQTSNKVLRYALTTDFDIGTASFSAELALSKSTNNAGFAFSRNFRKIAVINTSSSVTDLSMGSTAFEESVGNDGRLEGSLVVSLVGDTFVSAGSTLTPTTHYTINNLIQGFTPVMTVDASGLTATLTFSGRTTSNQDTLDVSSVQFTFTDAAFTALTAANVTNSTGPAESGFGIDLDAGFNQPNLAYSIVPNVSDASISGTSISLSAYSGLQDITFSEDGTSMFAITTTDSVFQFTLSTAFDVSTATITNKKLSFGNLNTTPVALEFDNSGGSLFILGDVTDAIYEYTLTTSYDLSTATYSGRSLTVSTFDTSPAGFTFSNDGKKLFLVGNTSRAVDEITLPNAFDISSGTLAGTFALSTGLTYNTIEFSSDGKSFVVGSTASVIQYNNTSAFTVAGSTSASSFSLSTTGGNAKAFTFDDSYTRFISLATNLSLIDYSIPKVAYKETLDNDGQVEGLLVASLRRGTFSSSIKNTDISVLGIPSGFTSSVALGADLTTVSVSLTGQTGTNEIGSSVSDIQITFANDAFDGLAASDVGNSTLAKTGLGMSFTAGSNIAEPEISYSRLPNISNISSSPTRSFTFADARSMAFNTDGSKLYVLNLNSITEYALTEPYVISGATQRFQLSISSQESNARGIVFNQLGSRLFVIGATGEINTFRLTLAYDLSTASFVQVANTLTDDSAPRDIAFNDAGTKLYILGETNDQVTEYALSTAFDPSTATLTDNVSLGTSITSPQGFGFSQDGSTFFVIDAGQDRLFQFDLSTAYDVSTATAKSINVSVSSSLTTPTGLHLSNDGRTILLSGSTADQIFQYSFPTDAFVENSGNTGLLGGRLIARIIGDTFKNSGSTFTQGTEVTVASVPTGITPTIGVSGSGLVMTLDYGGNALSNDTSNNVADIAIAYTNDAFTNLKASEISTSTGTNQTGYGISYTAGSSLALDVVLSANNDPITDVALNGNTITAFSWKTTAGTSQAVIDTVTIKSSGSLGSLFSNFSLWVSSSANGTGLKQLSPGEITNSDTEISFRTIRDTLNIIEEAYYFVRATVSGVSTSTGAINFSLASTDLKVSGANVGSSTVSGSNISFTDKAFAAIQDGTVDSIAYGETKIVDVNNDDQLDIIAAGSNKSGTNILKYFTNSNGVFATGVSFGTPKDSVRLAPGDFDNDNSSEIDLLIQGYATGNDGGTLYNNNNLTNAKEFDDLGGNLIDGDVAAGDLDGDGDLDLIMTGHEDTNSSSFKVRIFVNGGSNNYTLIDTLTITPVIDGDLELADVDNDGDLDVFVTGKNASGAGVSTLYLRGTTGFTASASSFTAVAQSAADFGDYNGDGLLDLVVSGIDPSSSTISTTIYINGGSGTFSASSIAAGNSHSGDVKWIDLDNDGDMDLVQTGVSSTGNKASIWINDGTTLTESFSDNLTGLSRGNIAYGDIDGDDDLDLVMNGLTGTSTFVTKIYRNDMYSGLVSNVQEPTSLTLTAESSKFTIDWDSVGGVQYELIIVQTDSAQNTNVIRSADSRRLTGFIRNPEKPRLRRTKFELNNVSRGAYRLGVQRVNNISKGSGFKRIGDFFFGTPFTPTATAASDITASSFTANWNAQVGVDSFTVTLVREETVNNATSLVTEGTFKATTNSYEFKNLRRNRNYRYTVKSFNGTVSSGTSNEVRVILPLSASFISTNITGLTDANYDDLVLADFNDDDKLDIVATSGTSSFLLLNGSSSAISLAATRSSSSMEVFDFGNDGDMDIFVTGTSNSSGVTSFFQNAANVFTETVTNSSQFLQAKTASGDIDNDGDVDVVLMGLATSSTVKTEVLINNGTNFDSLAQDFLADTQGDLGLTDFDLDGDLDLLVLGTSAANVYLNQSGTFNNGLARTFDFLSEVDMKLADMTGDGRPDVIYSGVSSGTSFLKIYSSNDTLGFVKITDLNVSSLSSSAPRIEVIDGDNDGDLDVFLVGTESMELYSNPSNGVLTTSDAININISGLSTAAVAFGDYDNDEDVDILFSGVNGSNANDAGLLSNASDNGNDPPSAPTNLDITFPSGNWLLQWNPSTDDKTAAKQLNYNVLIQSTTQNLTYQSANPTNGFRKVTGYGDIQDTTWAFNPVNLPIGDYTWRVQAIDANGQGSAFSATSPLTVPDTVKIFNNQPAIASGEIDGGTENVVFFSFGINATDNSTLDSLIFTLSADYREYMQESTFKLFRSVDANPDLSPEDQLVEAQASSDGTTLTVSGLNVSLSQQQVYFFLVAQTKFVAASGEFQVTLNSSNIFLKETGFVNETGSLTGPLISVLNAVTTYTPGSVSVTNFEASAENQEIMVFSANANVAGVSLKGLNISGSSSIGDKFENIRVFSSSDNSLDVSSDMELGSFTVDGSTMVAEFNSALPGAGTDQFYFVVADVLSSVTQSTASLSLTLNSPGDLTFSSTELNTVEFSTSDYTFYFDLVPPDVRYGTFDENVRQGSGPHAVSFTVQDQFEITAVDFFWRKLAESSFQRVSQTVNSNGSYSFEFSATDIGSVGVEFYASATDLDGNTNDPEVRSIGIFFDSSDPIDFKSEANIKLEGESVTDYSLIAFPFQSGRFSDVLSGLENAKHGGLAELFSGDDNTKYRIVGLRGGASDASGFQELTLSSTFSPGAGYYLIVGVKEADIQIVSAETVDASSDNPHTVSLSAGWNMIGNPYLFPISLESIRDYNLAVGNISDASVINDIRLFKNGQFVSNPSTMERFDGAFIRVTENVSSFAFPMNDEIPSNSGGRMEFTRWDEVVDEDSWRLNLTIQQGNQLSLGGFGVKEDALVGEDDYDQFVLPAPGNYIRLQHEIDDELTVIRSSVKAPDLVNVWNASLHAVRDGVMTLEWDHESVTGLARSLYLFDPVGLRFIDMKAQGHISLSVSKGANELLFFYGPEDLKEEVIADRVIAVGQVYPNPVTDQIALNLIGQAEAEVLVKLYDLFGKEILGAEETLKFTGVNTLTIAIDDRLKSGLYFLEVQVSSDKGTYRSKQKVLIND